MGVFSASDVAIVRRGRASSLALVAVGVPCALVLACALGGPAGEAWLPAVAIGVMLEAVLFLLSPAILPDGAWTGERRVALRADARGVSANGRPLLARGRIASAAVERHVDGTARVLLLGDAARVELEVRLDDARVPALLDALGLGADHSTASFTVERAPLVSSIARGAGVAARALAAGALLAATVWAMRRGGDGWLAAYPPALVVLLATMKRARRMGRVVVGADGVAVRATRRARIVPYDRVVAVRRTARGARVELVDGGELALDVPGHDDDADARRDALAKRIDEGLRAAAFGRRARADRDLASMLARGGRTLDAWLHGLAGAAEVASYRVAALAPERLWSIVEDASAEPSARAAAAVLVVRGDGACARREADRAMRGGATGDRARAVRGAGPESAARDRLLAAARTSAHPGLRAALQAVARGAEDGEALGAVDAAVA